MLLSIYKYISFGGNLLLVFVKSIIYIDMAVRLNEVFVNKKRQEENRKPSSCMFISVMLCLFIMFSISLYIYVMLILEFKFTLNLLYFGLWTFVFLIVFLKGYQSNQGIFLTSIIFFFGLIQFYSKYQSLYYLNIFVIILDEEWFDWKFFQGFMVLSTFSMIQIDHTLIEPFLSGILLFRGYSNLKDTF
eukprot:gene11176-3997_t